MKKFLAILFSMVLVLSLFAGCGDKDSGGAGGAAGNGSNNGGTGTNNTEGSGDQVNSATNPSGALVLNANAAVTVSYDSNGLVISMEGANENGNVVASEYENFLGKPCADVVCDLIAGSSSAGFLTEEVNFVVIKQVIGSSVPTDGFLLGIEKDAEEAISAANSQAKLVVLTLDDLDQQGYINVEAAKTLMQAYMSNDSTEYLCVGSDTLIDGLYGFLFGYDAPEKLIVDANTGDVYMGELEGVDYGDGTFEEDELVTEPTDDILGDENEPEVTEPVVTPEDEVIESTEPTEPEEAA